VGPDGPSGSARRCWCAGPRPTTPAPTLDGIQIPILYHFGGRPLGHQPPSSWTRFDFYPGGFGAEYGARHRRHRRRGHPPGDRPASGTASAKVDLLDSGAYLAVPLNDALLASPWGGRRPQLRRPVSLPLVLSGQFSSASRRSTSTTRARLDFHPKGSRHSLQLFGFGSDDLLKVVFAPGGSSNEFRVNNHTGFQRLVAAWDVPRGPAHQTACSFFAGKNENSIGLDILQVDQDDNVLGRPRAPWRCR